MGTRGRPSAEALTVITPSGVETIRRPEPPAELTEEQAAEWRKVVNRLSADWFPAETHGMLAAYCCHVVERRHVAQLIAQLKASRDFDVAEYDKLLKMQERESRALSSLATRMRMSQQTTYDEKKKKPKLSKRPWDFDAG